EPPRTIVLWGLTLATIPAGQGKLLCYTSHAEKAVFFFKESSCISFVGCLKRRTVDSWVWDCALLVPSKTIAITRPTENICGNSTCLKTPEQNVMGWKAKIATSCRNAFMTNILLARG